MPDKARELLEEFRAVTGKVGLLDTILPPILFLLLNGLAGFTAAMMLKDLRLAQDAARAGGATTPLGAGAAALYGLYVGHGEGARDFSGIIKFLRGA